jgi:hypothetical protein
MKVVDKDSWIRAIDLFQIGEAFLIEPEGLIVLHIADMLTRNGKCPLGQGEGVLEVRPAPQDLRAIGVKLYGVRCKSSGSAKEHDRGISISGSRGSVPHLLSHHSNHRVIDTHEDVAVMDEKGVHNSV